MLTAAESASYIPTAIPSNPATTVVAMIAEWRVKRRPSLRAATPAGLEEMFFEVGTGLAEGTTTALPPTHEEIERLLAAAPRYGVEILAG